MCPIHAELTDVYQLTIRTAITIPVEDILKFVAQFQTKQIFQEDMTQEIAVGLGVHAETVGVHSGVTVRSVAP